MKKTFSLLTISFIAFGAMTSCNTTEENEAPTVTIISPKAENNPYMSGNSMNINIEFSDDVELHELSVEVVREFDGAVVYHAHPHSHTSSYTFNVDTVLTTTEHSDFTVTAVGSDHDDKITTVTETIHMHPM
jgi:hypothetical protein